MERHVLMKLRNGIATDFSDERGNKKQGVLYFEQSSTGALHPFPKYFSSETNELEFKILYSKKQIFVPMNCFDEVAVLEEELIKTV